MLRKILAGIRQFLLGCVALPFDFARWLLGQQGAVMQPADDPYNDAIEAQTSELWDRLEAPARDLGHAVRTLGGHVHAYAADRETADLSAFPEHVAVALFGLDDRQLAVLAAAGPVACGRWALGQRSGIVGLPAVAAEALVPVGVTTQDGAQAAVLVPANEPPCGRQLPLAA